MMVQASLEIMISMVLSVLVVAMVMAALSRSTAFGRGIVANTAFAEANNTMAQMRALCGCAGGG